MTYIQSLTNEFKRKVGTSEMETSRDVEVGLD